MARRVGQSGGARPRPGVHAIYEDYRPASEWKYEKEAQQSHFLILQLPGYVKEQIKVSTEGTNTLRVRGKCLISGNKWSRFEEDFRIPDDCNIRGIRAKFESFTLTITMPKKGHPTTITQVTPKKEETQIPHLEPPPKGPGDERGTQKIEQETKEKVTSKVIEEVKESKKDEDINEDSGKKANEVYEGNETESLKPGNYFEKIEKNAEEKRPELKKKDNVKSKKVMEGISVGKGTKEIGPFRPENNCENIEKKVKETSREVNEKIKYKKVVEGFNIDNKPDEHGKGKRSFKPENHFRKAEMIGKEGHRRREKENVKEKYKEIVNGMTKGDLEEERQLMVNVGVAALVIVAFGAYIIYGLGSYAKAKA